jgi:hypothetical protein
MPSETESLALHLVRVLYEATGDRPQQWHVLAAVDGMTAEAIVFAVARGWVLVEAAQSICLTDTGRCLVDRLAR